MDCEIIHNSFLKEEVKKGLNHIPEVPVNPKSICQELRNVWVKVAKTMNIIVMPCQLECIDNIVNEMFHQHFPFFKKNQYLWFQNSALMDEINYLTNHLYIFGLDKAAQTPVFMCKALIRSLSHDRLSSVEFNPCLMEEQELFENIKRFSKELKMEEPSQWSLPFIMGMYKVHKKDIRWITNAHNCSFSIITDKNSKLLNALNQGLIEVTNNLHDKIFMFYKVHINAYWIIQNQFEFLLNLPDKISSVFTFDIKSCYEAIPHFELHGLIDSLGKVILTVKKLGYIGFQFNKKNCKLTKKLKKVTYSFEEFTQINVFLLNNCVTKFGKSLFKQIRGIPMGYSCSPIWCNLFLAWFELEYIRKLSRLNRIDIIKEFYGSARFMDDLAFINNNTVLNCLNHSNALDENDIYSIYPLNILQIKPTYDTYSTTFLNIGITWFPNGDGEYVTSTAWKRDKLPCQSVAFIHAHSNRPRHMAYKVCISQVLPIIYNASNMHVALYDLTKLRDAFINNGFNKVHIQRNVVYFLQNNTFPGLKFSIKDLLAVTW